MSADDLVVERVLRCVECIPAGRVASYGAIGAICDVGARQVGQVMASWGSDVAWWRVTNASGDLPRHLLARAHDRWLAEGITLKPNGRGCCYAAFACDLDELHAAWLRASADLPARAAPR